MVQHACGWPDLGRPLVFSVSSPSKDCTLNPGKWAPASSNKSPLKLTKTLRPPRNPSLTLRKCFSCSKIYIGLSRSCASCTPCGASGSDAWHLSHEKAAKRSQSKLQVGGRQMSHPARTLSATGHFDPPSRALERLPPKCWLTPSAACRRRP